MLNSLSWQSFLGCCPGAKDYLQDIFSNIITDNQCGCARHSYRLVVHKYKYSHEKYSKSNWLKLCIHVKSARDNLHSVDNQVCE